MDVHRRLSDDASRRRRRRTADDGYQRPRRTDRQTDRHTQYIAIHRRPAIERSKHAGLRIDASKARIMCQGSTFTFTSTTVTSDPGEDTHVWTDRQTDGQTDNTSQYIAVPQWACVEKGLRIDVGYMYRNKACNVRVIFIAYYLTLTATLIRSFRYIRIQPNSTVYSKDCD